MELIRTINCGCGNWEEFPADMPRESSQTFSWLYNINNDKNQAFYRCPDCHARVKSKIIEVESQEPEEVSDIVEEKTCRWCDKPCEKDFCSEECATQWVNE